MKKKIVILSFLVLCGCQHIKNDAVANDNIKMVTSYYGAGEKLSSHTANGQRFNPNSNTAAHKKLPFGTKLLLTNPKNNRNIIVSIVDRGPFTKGRDLDVTYGVAKKLGISGVQTLDVKILKE